MLADAKPMGEYPFVSAGVRLRPHSGVSRPALYQTIAAALIAVINSLSSGGECVKHYRAVQHAQSAARACVHLFIFRTSICVEGSTRVSRRASSDKAIPILQRPGPNDTE